MTDARFDTFDSELSAKIDIILDTHGHDPSKLIGILLEIQDAVPKRYIPAAAAKYVSEKLGIPFSQAYDVITFYAALSPTPRADYVIQVCDSVVCRVVGNTALKDALGEVLGIGVGETTADGRFCIEAVPCFGACDISPAIRINSSVYGGLTSAEKVREVIAGYIKEANA